LADDRNWTYAFCGAGILLMLSGLVLAAMGFGPEIPWFAPIVLGIVAFTFGLTFQDAHDNENDNE
jgi:hypothetical protein